MIHDHAEWFDRQPIDPETSDPGMISRVLDTVRDQVHANTWQAFWRTAVEGQRPVDVAESLGMSSAAVCMSRSRILRRIRRLLDGLEVFPE